MNDFLSKEISLNLSDPKIIAMFLAAAAVGAILFVFILFNIKKTFNEARNYGISLFNVFSILLFALPMSLYMLVDYFKNNLLLTVMVFAVCWGLALLVNISRCYFKCGIMVSFFQILFAFIISLIVQTIVSLIVFVVGLIICYFVFGPEMFDFLIVMPDGRMVGIAKTGKDKYIDTDGNSFTYVGSGTYMDSNGNSIRHLGRGKDVDSHGNSIRHLGGGKYVDSNGKQYKIIK